MLLLYDTYTHTDTHTHTHKHTNTHSHIHTHILSFKCNWLNIANYLKFIICMNGEYIFFDCYVHVLL